MYKIILLLITILMAINANASLSQRKDGSKIETKVDAGWLEFRSYISAPSNNSFFDPKIKVKYGMYWNTPFSWMNFSWTETKSIGAWGECKILMGLTRFCARPAAASQPQGKRFGNETADHIGCDDQMIANCKDYPDGDPRNSQANPRVLACVYEDPSATLGDFSDFMIDFQPFQHNEPTKELDEISDASNWKQPQMAPPVQFYLDASKILAGIVGIFTNDVNWAVTTNDSAHFNDDGSLGCIELPLGPYPPPFCPVIIPPKILPTAKRVCAQNEVSQNDNICVPVIANGSYSSSEDSKVRVLYEDIIFKCPEDTAQNGNTGCVMFSPAEFNSGDMTKTTDFGKRPYISGCTGAPNEPCVSVPQDMIRADSVYFVYYKLYDTTASAYAADSLTQWFDVMAYDPSGKYKLVPYAISIGNYADIDAVYNSPFVDPVYNQVNLQEPNQGNTYTFYTRIDPESPDNICAYYINSSSVETELECFKRPQMTKPVVTFCDDDAACYNITDAECNKLCSYNGQPYKDYNSEPHIIIGDLAKHKFQMLLGQDRSDTATKDNEAIWYGMPLTATLVDKNNAPPNIDENGNTPTTDSMEYQNGIYYGGAASICVQGYQEPEIVVSALSSPGMASTLESDLKQYISNYVYNLSSIWADLGYSEPQCQSANCNHKILEEYWVQGNFILGTDNISYPGRQLPAVPSGTDPNKVLNTNTEATRSKTPLEGKLCVAVPPACVNGNVNLGGTGLSCAGSPVSNVTLPCVPQTSGNHKYSDVGDICTVTYTKSPNTCSFDFVCVGSVDWTSADWQPQTGNSILK